MPNILKVTDKNMRKQFFLYVNLITIMILIPLLIKKNEGTKQINNTETLTMLKITINQNSNSFNNSEDASVFIKYL